MHKSISTYTVEHFTE